MLTSAVNPILLSELLGLRRVACCLSTSLCCVAFAAPAAGANTWYVAPSGSGAACAALAPCSSMNAAYKKAHLGDTVLLAGGDYRGQVLSGRSLPGVNSLAPSGEEITFMPQPGASVSIDGMEVGAAHGAPVEHVVFRDLTFTGFTVTRSGEDVHFVNTIHRAQLHANWVSYLSYQRVEVGPFVDDTGDGLQFNQIDGRGGDHILVERSRIHDVHPNNRDAHPDAVQIYGDFSDFTFRRNRLWDNDSINFRACDGTCLRMVIENNFFGAARNPVVSHYYAAHITSNGAVIRNNTFDGPIQPPDAGGGNDQVWVNNLAEGYSWGTCDFNHDDTVAGNVWYGKMPRGCGKRIGSPSWVGGGDYHLTAHSRARNAADARYAPASDLDGNPRDSTPDAGADEWYTPPPGGRERAARLVTGMHVTRTKRGFVLRFRLARRARVGAWMDRRKHKHYHAVRHLRTRPLAAGKRHVRLGRLAQGSVQDPPPGDRVDGEEEPSEAPIPRPPSHPVVPVGHPLAVWLGIPSGPPKRVYDRRMEALSATTRQVDLPDLTPREHQVLQLVASGAANKRVALDLGMTEHTVKFHLASVFRKLGVTNRTEAAARYLSSPAAPLIERTHQWT